MGSRFRSLAEEEVQSYLGEVAAGRAGEDPNAKRMTQSPNPREAAVGTRILDQQQRDQRRQTAMDQAEANRQAKETERMAEEERQRQVRIGESQGRAKTTDVQTGKTTLDVLPGGGPAFKVGEVGKPEMTTVEQAGPPAPAAPGALPSATLGGTTMKQTVPLQRYRSETGDTIVKPLPTKTDQKTGVVSAQTKDQFGAPQELAVGVDAAIRAKVAKDAELEQRKADLDLRKNSLDQARMQFDPRWAGDNGVKKTYDNAAAALKKFEAAPEFVRVPDSGMPGAMRWAKVDPATGLPKVYKEESAPTTDAKSIQYAPIDPTTGAPMVVNARKVGDFEDFDPNEFVKWQKQGLQLKAAHDRAKAEHDRLLPQDERLKAAEFDVKDQLLKHAAEKIQHEHGMPDVANSAAETLAAAATGTPSPWMQAWNESTAPVPGVIAADSAKKAPNSPEIASNQPQIAQSGQKSQQPTPSAGGAGSAATPTNSPAASSPAPSAARYPVTEAKGDDLDYFRKNPNVTGMAIGAGLNESPKDAPRTVVLNPFSKNPDGSPLTETQKAAIVMNEGIRHFMDENKPVLKFEPTPEQIAFFAGSEYGKPENKDRLKETLVARIITGDESAGKITPEQQAAADEISKKFNTSTPDAGIPATTKKPLIPLDDPAKVDLFTRAAGGLDKPNEISVETSPQGVTWLTRTGKKGTDTVGRVDKDAQGNPYVVLSSSLEGKGLQKHVDYSAIDGVPIYLTEPTGATTIDPLKGAQYVADVFKATRDTQLVDAAQVLKDPQANAGRGQEATKARLVELKASPDQIAMKVRSGELSVQQGQAIMQGIYGLSLKASDPADPSEFGKWLSKQDSTTKADWNGAKNQFEKNIVKQKYLQQWEADNGWKPGVDKASVDEATNKVIPKPQKAFFGVVDTITGIVDMVKGFKTTPAAFYQAVEGLKRPDQLNAGARAAFESARKFGKEMELKTAIAQAEGTSTSTGESFRETGTSLPFSIISMTAYMAAKYVGGLAGQGVGAVAAGTMFGPEAAPVGGMVGKATVGTAAGMAASGAVAYRMAGAAFMYDEWQNFEDESQRINGRPMNEAEKAKTYSILLPLAQDTGLWEAGPEALGNAITAGVGKFVLGGATKQKFAKAAMKSLAARMGAFGEKAAVKVGATLGGVAGEVIPETITQVGQDLAQERSKLAREGKDPYSLGYDWSSANIQKAMGEVGPQVIATIASFGILHSATHGGGKVIDKIKGKPDAGTSTAPDAAPIVPPAIPITPEAQAIIDERDPAKVAEMHPNDYAKWTDTHVTPLLGAPISTPEDLGLVQPAITAARTRGDTATEQALTAQLQQSTRRTDWTAEELEMDDPATVEQINNDARDFNQSLTDARTRLGIEEQPQQTTQIDGQNLEGQTGAQTPAQVAQPATEGQTAGNTGGTGGSAPIAQSGPNLAGLTVKDYLVSQATGVAGYQADIPSVVNAAIAAGRPVHVSMATRAGVSMPAGYHQVGSMLQPLAAPAAQVPAALAPAQAIAQEVQQRVEASSPLLKGRIQITTEDKASGGAVVDGQDRMITLALPDIQRAINRANGDTAKVTDYLENIVRRHEAVHVVQFEAVRKLWEAAGSPGDFIAWFKQWYAKLSPELLTKEAEDAARKIYGKDNSTGEWNWDKITDPGMKAGEFVRMLIEAKLDPERTEDFSELFRVVKTQGAKSKLAELIRAAVEILTGMKLTPAAQEHVAKIEELYRELVGETKSEATPSKPTPARVEAETKQEPDAPAATVSDGFTTNQKQDGTVDIMLDGQMVDNVPADQVDASLAELRVIATSPGRVVGQAMQAVLDANPIIARDLKLKDALGAISDDLETLVETYPPEQRRAFLDNAFAEWVAGLEAIARQKEAEQQSIRNAESAEKAKQARESRMSRLRDKARVILNSDVYPALSAIFAKGKITPKPNAIALIMARRKKGARLTEKEMGIIRNLSDFDGAAMRTDYQGGGNNPLVVQILDMLYARQGEGQMPNVIADGLIPNVTTASEMWEKVGQELRALTQGKSLVDSLDDPNHVWTDAEIEEDQAKNKTNNPVTIYDARWEAEQAFGADSLLVKKIDVIDEFLDRFDETTMQDVLAAIYAEIGRINMEVVSAAEWQKRTEAFSRNAAIFQQFLDTHTPEAMRPKLAGLPVVSTEPTVLASSPAPEAPTPAATGDLFSSLVETPGPLAKLKENAQAAYDAKPEGHPARENIAREVLTREGVKKPGGFVGQAQRAMDFGVTGSMGTKDQMGFSLMSSPAPSNQRSFDFGTSGDFSTRNQTGFDFTIPKAETKSTEKPASQPVAEVPAETKQETVQKEGWDNSYESSDLASAEVVGEYLDIVQSLPDGAMQLHYDGMVLNEPLETQVQRILELEKQFQAIGEQSFDLQSERVKTRRENAQKQTPPPAPGTPEFKALPQAEKQAAVKQMASRKKAEREGLSDFGQVLPGARKNQQRSISTDISDSDMASQSLSTIWPKAEVDSIEDADMASIAHALRDEVPSKPRQDWKVARWVEKVKTVRTLMRYAEENGPEPLLNRMTADSGTLQDLVHKIRLLRDIPRVQWSRIGKLTNHPDAYRFERVEGESEPRRILAPYARAEVDDSAIMADSLDVLTAKVKEKLGGAKKAQTMKFEVRGTESKGYGINKKGDPLYRRLLSFPTTKEAFAYISGNYDALATAWESVKDSDNVKETDVRGKENRQRVGRDHLQGRDATPEMFTNALGFRGVEFGNWVAQGGSVKDRQGMLNLAYEALHDLADIMGIPPKAISLDGTLGLAFGSRGSGSASAHYESDTLVINLTKTKGAGKLAHEWFHALDHYFQKQRPGKSNVAHGGNFITYQPEAYYQNQRTGDRLSATRFGYIKNGGGRFNNIEDWKRIEGVRPQVEERFVELVKALDNSPMNKRSQLIDKGKSDGYWSRVIERAARSFENYTIAKMQQNGFHNDYLANVVSPDSFIRDINRYPYLLDDETGPIVEAFDNLFSTIETRETDRGTALMSSPAPESEFKKIRTKLTTDLTRKPNEHQYEPTSETRPEIKRFLAENQLSPVTPTDLRLDTDDIERVSGTQIVFVRKGTASSFASANSLSVPRLIAIDSESAEQSIGYMIAHEMIHVAQKSSNAPSSPVLAKMQELISQEELQALRIFLVKKNYQDIPQIITAEIHAHLVADAVTGSNTLSLQYLANRKELTPILIEYFDSLPKLEPDASPGQYFAEATLASSPPPPTKDAAPELIEERQTPLDASEIPTTPLTDEELSQRAALNKSFQVNYGIRPGNLESQRERLSDSSMPPLKSQLWASLQDNQPDLFAATHAPDATQRLGSVKVGTMSALGAYRALTAKRNAGKTLTADENQKLLDAEQALGQKLAFDMEAVKTNEQPAALPITEQPARTATTPATRTTQQGLSLADDGPGGQMSLLSSPAPEDFSTIHKLLTSDLSKPANQYEYTPTEDIRPEVQQYISIAGYSVVAPAFDNSTIKAIESATGTAIVFIRGAPANAHADTDGRTPTVIGINADGWHSSIGYNIVHELVHVAQKDSRSGIIKNIADIRRLLTPSEMLEIQNWILGNNYPDNPYLIAAETQAFLTADAVIGTDYTALSEMKNSEELTRVLRESFAALKKLNPDNQRGEIFSTGRQQNAIKSTTTPSNDTDRMATASQGDEGKMPDASTHVQHADRTQIGNAGERQSGNAGEPGGTQANIPGSVDRGREGRDGQTTSLMSSPAPEDARYLELAKDPEGNAAELQRMVDERADLSRISDGFIDDKEKLSDNISALEDSASALGLRADVSHISSSGSTYIKIGPKSAWENPRDKWDDFTHDGGELVTLRMATHARQLSSKLNHDTPQFDGSPTDALWEATRRFANEPGVKSLDTIIRDLDGNVVPISHRFEMLKQATPARAAKAAEMSEDRATASRSGAELEKNRTASTSENSQRFNAGSDSILYSSPAPEMSEAVKQSLAKMPPVYRNVFEAVNAGSSVPEVMAKFKVNEKAVENILKAVRSRMATATAAAGPAGLSPVMRGDKIMGGRPDLALSGIPHVAAVDQIRNESGIPDVRGWDQVIPQAAAMLRDDYQGTYDRLLEAARDMRQMSDTEVAASKMIIARETLAGKIQTPEDRVKLALMIHGYRDIGTATARSLAIRRDASQSPAERHAQYIAEALFTPDAGTRNRLRTGKPGDAERILAGWMKRVDTIKAELLTQGIDLEATLKEFREDEEARKTAADESPRAAEVVEEQIRKLNLREKTVIDTIRQGSLLTRAAFTAGVSNEEAKAIYTRFMGDIRSAMAASAKRYLETSLASSPVDMMGEILAELGLPDISAIDDSQPGFVDHRGDKKRAPRKPKAQTPAAPQVPTLTPEQQTALDEAFERFKAAKPSTWGTFWQTEAKNLTPVVGAVGFSEFKDEAQKAWTAEQAELFARERGAINETTGTFDLHDPVAMARVIEAFAVARGGKVDAIMEYWRMSILSGIQTHNVNIMSTAMNVGFHLGPRRAIEAMVNNLLGTVSLGSDKAATFGEFAPMVREISNAWSLAARNALRSWQLDWVGGRVFDSYAEATAIQLDFSGSAQSDYISPALGGKFGKVMRSISFRALQTADTFLKSFYGHIEAVAQAHRIAAVEEKLTGDAYDVRIAELMQTGSEAWVRALDGARYVAFQQESAFKNMGLGEMKEKAKNTPILDILVDSMIYILQVSRGVPLIGRVSTFFLPFLVTPANINKQAIGYTPLGAFISLVDASRSLRRRVFRGELTKAEAQAEVAELYNKARLVQDATNQVIALAVLLMIVKLAWPDDDDELPWMTGTTPYKTTKRGERDNAYAVMPPMSVRLPGGAVFSYGRFEPFSTSAASMVDLVVASKRHGAMTPAALADWSSRFKDRIKDQSFMQGLSNLFKAIEDPDRWAERLAANTLTGFVPNLIRQPLREIDTQVRDVSPREEDGFFTSLAKSVGYSLVPQSAPAKQTVWGEDIPTNRGQSIGPRATDMAFRIFDPTNLTLNPQADPIDRWIYRWNLQTVLKENRISIEPIKDKIEGRIPGEKKDRVLPLTKEEQSEANRRAGQMARKILGDNWATRALNEEDAKRIADTVSQVQTIIRKELRQKKIMELIDVEKK